MVEFTISRAENGLPVRGITAARLMLVLEVDRLRWHEFFPEHFPPVVAEEASA